MRAGMFGLPLQTTEETISLLTGSGYYAVPLWARWLRVRLCAGAGGGGSGGNSSTGGAGGGSGFITEVIVAVCPGMEIPYSCGAGGAGGAGTGAVIGNNGENGNNTTFGRPNNDIYLIARGGRSGRGGGSSVIEESGKGASVGTNPGEGQPAGLSGLAGGPSPLTGVVALGSTVDGAGGANGEYGGGGGGGRSHASGGSGSSGGTGGNGWIQIEAVL